MCFRLKEVKGVEQIMSDSQKLYCSGDAGVEGRVSTSTDWLEILGVSLGHVGDHLIN